MLTRKPRFVRRTGRVAFVLLGVMVAAACSSGTKPTAAPTTVGTVGTAGTRPAGSSCGSQTASGAQGAGDVLVPGDIPDNQAYVVYQSPTSGYQISVPEGWPRAQAGEAVTYSDKFNSIRVEVVAAPSAPSVASAQSSEVAALATSAPCFVAGKVSQVSRQAGPVVLITYRADSPADPVTGKVVRLDVQRYDFWQAGKTAIVTLSSPQGSDNVDPWRKVTDSFRWGP